MVSGGIWVVGVSVGTEGTVDRAVVGEECGSGVRDGGGGAVVGVDGGGGESREGDRAVVWEMMGVAGSGASSRRTSILFPGIQTRNLDCGVARGVTNIPLNSNVISLNYLKIKRPAHT